MGREAVYRIGISRGMARNAGIKSEQELVRNCPAPMIERTMLKIKRKGMPYLEAVPEIMKIFRAVIW